MELHLKINPTDTTPLISFDGKNGILNIEGKSTDINIYLLCEPVIEWLNSYFEKPITSTVFNIRMEYFNTVTSKCLFDIFKIMEAKIEQSMITVNWYYQAEDDDVLEAGEDYRDLINLPFTLIEIK